MWYRCRGSSTCSVALAAALVGCGDGGGGETGGTTEAATTAAMGTTTEEGTGGEPTSESSGEPSGSSGSSGASGDTGSSTGEGSSSGGVDVCADSVLTWDSFGEAFALTWCTGCHHSALPSAERACAPCAANFDTHAGFSERAGLIGVRVIDHAEFMVPPMPPAAKIPEDELARLREWIDCGAPGPETGQQGPACPDPGAMTACP